MPILISRRPSWIGATRVLVAGWLWAIGSLVWTQHDDVLRFNQATAQIHARNLEEHLTQALHHRADSRCPDAGRRGALPHPRAAPAAG